MFLFTHGNAHYEAEVDEEQRDKIIITRTVFTCAGHPEQNVKMYHYLAFSWPVYDIFVDANEIRITLRDGRCYTYTFDEIEQKFAGGGGEDDESVKRDKHDNVNHPAHYKTSSGLEAIDVIDAFTEDLKGYESVYTSQVLKYTLRWKHKNGLEDLEKANWYLTRLINKLKEAQK